MQSDDDDEKEKGTHTHIFFDDVIWTCGIKGVGI